MPLARPRPSTPPAVPMSLTPRARLNSGTSRVAARRSYRSSRPAADCGKATCGSWPGRPDHACWHRGITIAGTRRGFLRLSATDSCDRQAVAARVTSKTDRCRHHRRLTLMIMVPTTVSRLPLSGVGSRKSSERTEPTTDSAQTSTPSSSQDHRLAPAEPSQKRTFSRRSGVR
jgi:hypothetical protein